MLSFLEIGPPVPEEKIFEWFLPSMDMAAILVIWPGLFMYTLVPPSYRCFISNLALIGYPVSEKTIFEYYGDIHIYCPGVGGRPVPGVHFFQNHKFSVHLPISFKFFSSNDILTIFPIRMHGPPQLTMP